ncbi:MAG: WD40/YVTN/BNR-like repeat-containing protein [Fimbriimonadaceae bacterium]
MPRLWTALCVALSLVAATSAQEVNGLKAPPSAREDQAKFHPRVEADSAEARLRGYAARLALEALSPFGQLSWRNVGPEIQGGRVIDIDAPKDDPTALHVAYATGGLWRTNDWGISWTPLFDTEAAFGIGDIAVSRDGKTIWVGTGENNSQRTSYQGLGVYKSTDAGQTWTNVGLHNTYHIGRVVIDPRNEDVVYVAAIGRLYSENDERGVFKTTDGGKNWNQVLKINDQTGVIDLVIDPKNPDTLIAGAWDRSRRAWDFRDAGPGSGVYRTTDGGRNWNQVTTGLPTGDSIGRIGLSICASQPNVVYAFIDNWNPDPDSAFADEMTPSGVVTPRRFRRLTSEMFVEVPRPALQAFVASYMPQGTTVDNLLTKVRSGEWTMNDVAAEMEKRNESVFEFERAMNEVYRSDDNGVTWRRTHDYKLGSHGGYYWGKIVVSPTDPDDVFTLGVILLRSRDGGKTWERSAQGTHVDYHAVWYDPTDPRRILIGNDGGLDMSGDDGQTWRSLNNLPVGQFTTIAVDMKTPYNIYGGLQDNGTMKGPSTYVPGRSQPHAWTSIGGGDGSWVAVDPRDGGDVVYIASQFGAHSGVNQKTGERWNARAPNRPGEEPQRYNWVSPLIISPHNPNVIYLGSQRVNKSVDMGRNWEWISGDITKNRPKGDVPHSTIKVLDESPLKEGLIYAGTDDGKVMMTPDGGTTWIDVSTPADKWVTRVVASKYDEGTVYVSQSGYREDDFTPYLWKSTDYGKTWTSIAGNLPTEWVNVVREDPTRQEMLYVGTGLGVYVTFDGGQNWEPLNAGIPRTPVHDLVIHPREMDLVIGTHARSVWILNARLLQGLTDEVRSQDLYLFPVQPSTYSAQWAYRRRPNWDKSTPTEPGLNGWLWTKTPGAGTVRLIDANGTVVKTATFESGRGLQPFSIDFLLEPGRLDTVDPKAWDPKTLAEILADPFAEVRPKYVGPGEYTLEIEVAGKTARVPWTMRSGGGGGPGGGRRGGADG